MLRTTRKWRAFRVGRAQAASLSFAAACRELASTISSVCVAACIRPAGECYRLTACAAPEIETRTFTGIRLLFRDGGQAFKTEDRRSRIHLAPARWDGKIRIERIDARRAHCQRYRTCNGRASSRRSLGQRRSVREHSRFHRSETFSSPAEHERGAQRG